MEEFYYVVKDDLGISIFDFDNDSMSAIDTSPEQDEWKEFDLQGAVDAARFTGYNIIPVKKDS